MIIGLRKCLILSTFGATFHLSIVLFESFHFSYVIHKKSDFATSFDFFKFLPLPDAYFRQIGTSKF